MIRRRDQLRIPGILGCAATVSLLATGCDALGQDEWIRYCVRHLDSVIVEDQACDDHNRGDDPNSPFGWYYQQLGAHTGYEDDNGSWVDTTPDYVVLAPGRTAVGGSYARPSGAISYGRVYTAGAAPRPGPGLSSPSSGRVISRGGFGVARAGGGSGGS